MHAHPDLSMLIANVDRSNGAAILRDAETLYKVDADAIALKVKQEFATR